MRDLIQQERFELEVLEWLNRHRLLDQVIFVGGTMLRLCHGMSRYSVDLDFWIKKHTASSEIFHRFQEGLARAYILGDAAEKRYSLVFEVRSMKSPRALKIEIRKDPRAIQTEWRIAYSPHATTQVLVRTATLEEMMKAKIEAFLDRGEIRDAYDLEFLVRRGVSVAPSFGPEAFHRLLRRMESLSMRDYKVKLGSLLESRERAYYVKENFKLLREWIQASLNTRRSV